MEHFMYFDTIAQKLLHIKISLGNNSRKLTELLVKLDF